MQIKFSGPAKRWIEALPVGNGCLGAVIFGDHPTQHIQVNEHTVWDGAMADRVSPTGLLNLAEIRRLLFTREYAKAQEMVERHMLYNFSLKSYQPLVSLLSTAISFWGEPTGFHRELDLNTGIHSDGYDISGHALVRECFCSMAHGVLVAHFRRGGTKGVGQIIRLDREQDVEANTALGDRLMLKGQLGTEGVRFCAQAIVRPEGGRMSLRGNAIEVRDVDAITIMLAGASSFVGPDDLSADPEARCAELLDKVRGMSYEQLRQAHIAAHQEQMGRVTLSIEGGEDRRALPMNERLQAFAPEVRTLSDESLKPLLNTPADWSLYSTIFQGCRYMLVASSQPGSQPSTLQGRWCGTMNAPWNSDYHANINLQMNYWLANVCGLDECNLPLFDWLAATAATSGRDTAKRLYDCRGWVLHHASDIFATTAPLDGPCGVWPMGGAWMCQHIWEHYLFTRDTKVLAKYATLMFSAAEFMLDYLVEAPEGTPFAGKLVTAPSHSPENTFFTDKGEKAWISVAAAMDTQIIEQLFRNCLMAMKELHLEEVQGELRNRIEASIKRLPPMQISPRSGRLMEWLEDFDEPQPGHRHMSHMFGLYPGDAITPTKTPELAQAARKSIEHRLANDYHATGWSLPWLACLFARLGEGDKALDMLTNRIGNFTMPNALYSNAHGQPQVGDACGFAAAIAEILLQSHEGFIHVLPALPSKWPSGSVKGLRARGGFALDIAWSEGKASRVVISSKSGMPCRVVLQGHATMVVPKGAAVSRTPDGTMIEFPTVAGSVYEIES